MYNSNNFQIVIDENIT